LLNSPLESSCVVVALVENYSASKPLKASPEKSHILSCDTFLLGVRYVSYSFVLVPHGFVALLWRSEKWHSLSSLRVSKLKGTLMFFAFNTFKWVITMKTRNTLCANNDLCSNTAFERHWQVWIYYDMNDFLTFLPLVSCLLPPASCLLPPASCLLPPTSIFPHLTGKNDLAGA
jgi:hypothetical protein